MLEVRNLKKNFGKNEVLKGINFELEKGDRLAIIGSSGCGKSTLLRCLNMIEKPSGGKVILDGKEICSEDLCLSFVRSKMGMVFQQFNLFSHLTVLENITLAPVTLNILSKDDAKKKAFELLDSIGLKDKANYYPSQLSGGQKQRVAIIRTLIMDPEIILFDEPTSALDPEMSLDVIDLIMDVLDKGITMVIVSHEMNFVKKIANKVMFLDEGEISFLGSVKEAFGKTDNIRLKEFLSKNVK